MHKHNKYHTNCKKHKFPESFCLSNVRNLLSRDRHLNFTMRYGSLMQTMFCPHLVLVFSSEGFNKVRHSERFPHQDCDFLEANHQFYNKTPWQISCGIFTRVGCWVPLPCQPEECRGSRWAEHHLNLSENGSRWLSFPKQSGRHVGQCGPLTYVPKWQDDRIKGAFCYQPTHTCDTKKTAVTKKVQITDTFPDP